MSKRNHKVDADVCAEKLRAVADGERLRIVCFLQGGARSVGDIADGIGVSIVNASHHLQVLKRADMILPERRGRQVFYCLAGNVFPRAPGELDLGCCKLQIDPKNIT